MRSLAALRLQPKPRDDDAPANDAGNVSFRLNERLAALADAPRGKSRPAETPFDEVPRSEAGAPIADKKPQDYTDEDWAELERCMDAYFKTNVDILASGITRTRTTDIGEFAGYYSDRLDEKFPFAKDQEIRAKIDGYFREISQCIRGLAYWRTLLLVVTMGLLIASVQYLSPWARDAAGAALAAATGSFLSGDRLLWLGIGGSVIVYFVLWFILTTQAQRRVFSRSNAFQSDLQQYEVKKLYTTYVQIPSMIMVARRRRQKSTQETNLAVTAIERYVRLMVWIPKRVEYYEKAFEVRYWRMLDHDFLVNAAYWAVCIVLILAFLIGLSGLLPAGAASVSGGSLVFVLGLAAAFCFAASLLAPSFFNGLKVAGRRQLEGELNIRNWTRFGKFDMHNALADIVGDQVKEVHHAEDQIR